MKYIILLIIIFGSSHLFAQEAICTTITGKKDWQKVEITSDTTFVKNLTLACDAVVILKPGRKVTSINDLNAYELKILKMRAAKFKCCIIHIPLYQFGEWTSSVGGGSYK